MLNENASTPHRQREVYKYRLPRRRSSHRLEFEFEVEPSISPVDLIWAQTDSFIMLLYEPLMILSLAAQAVAMAVETETTVSDQGVYEAPLPGYQVVEMQWDVPVFPGQAAVSMNGTLGSVQHQARQLNPRWDQHMAELRAKRDIDMHVGVNLDKRAYVKKTIICGPGSYGWYGVPKIEFVALTNGFAPREMVPKPIPARSCSVWNCITGSAAIWWCNDVSRLT